MIRSIEAKDYLSKNPITFNEDTDLFQAIHTLLESKVSGGTVINENKDVVGVISELDCLKAILDGSYYGQVGGKVKDYMTPNPECLNADDSFDILDIAKRMLDGKRRRIPLVKDGKFAGQVSCRSLLQAMKDFVVEHDPSEDSMHE